MKGAGSIVSMDDSATVEDLSHGLDWTQWLLRSVRQRCAGVVLEESTSLAALRSRWNSWLEQRFIPHLGPCLLTAWEAACRRDSESLLHSGSIWESLLSPHECQRSLLAGKQLLRSLRGAKYTGLLSLLQELSRQHGKAAQLGIVWPVVASIFQVSPAVMLAEYLRLEIQCSARQLPALPDDLYLQSMLKAVQCTLQYHHEAWQTAEKTAD